MFRIPGANLSSIEYYRSCQVGLQLRTFFIKLPENLRLTYSGGTSVRLISFFSRLNLSIGDPANLEVRPAWVKRAWSAAVPLALIALTFAAFSPGLGNQFVNWDDGHNLLENDHFRGLGWDEVTWAWTTFHMGVYQPLGWLLFAVEYRAWGARPTGLSCGELGGGTPPTWWHLRA